MRTRRERSATSRPNGKIRFALRSSCTSWPLTRVRSASAPWSTWPAGMAGPMGSARARLIGPAEVDLLNQVIFPCYMMNDFTSKGVGRAH
jgi:hypothetical protein